MRKPHPSPARLIGSGLTAAALIIIALSIGVLFELDREARLHREVIVQLEATERGDALRDALLALGHAATLVAASGSEEARRSVESAAARAESALGQVAQVDPATGWTDPTVQSARLAILNARSIAALRGARGVAAGDEAAREAQRLLRGVVETIDRGSDTRVAELAKRTRARIASGERVRTYVSVALIGTLALLAIIYLLYRASRRRERAALARIAHLAHFDTVTGLPNRALLVDRLDLEVARAQRATQSFALFLFDLDGFKDVNDTWGHAAGDRALRLVGERARAVMRASDTVGRLGGDEFMALLPETGEEGAATVAEKLREALSRPYDLDVAEARMSASIGIAFFPRHGTDSETLRRAADTALYVAKREGKNRVRVALGGIKSPAADEPAAA